jgi:hypothetical protein
VKWEGWRVDEDGMMNSTPSNARPGHSTNLMLTAACVLLGLNLLRPMDLAGTAMAQSGDGSGLASALEQRKQMITALQAMERKLDKVEAALAKGIKVSEMPDLKLPSELKEALRSASKAEKSEKADKSPDTATR